MSSRHASRRRPSEQPSARPSTRVGQAGFTLVELMVAGTLVTLVLLMTIQLAITVIADMKAQREAHALERSARAPADYVVDLLRGAAAGTSTGDVQEVSFCTSENGVPVQGIGMYNSTGGADRLTILAAQGAVTSSRTVVDGTSTTLTLTNRTGFTPGDFVLLTNGTTGRIIKSKQITATTGTEALMTFDAPATTCNAIPFPTYPVGTLALRARVARFEVQNISGTSYLSVDPDGGGPAVLQPMAEGIEDFQVAIGVDDDGNGVLTEGGTDEWYYNTGDFTVPPPISGGRWRALRITIVAKELIARPGSGTVSARPAVENRLAGAADNYRRRVLTTMTEIRNLEMP